MATKNEKEIFIPYLENQYRKLGAMTYGEKLEVIEQVIEETKSGIVPVNGDQRIKLDPNNPAVQAIRDGKPVAVDGKKIIRSGSGPDKKWVNLAMAIGLLLIPIGLGIAWMFTSGEEPDEVVAIIEIATPTGTPTQTPTEASVQDEPEELSTAIPTSTAEPTFTPVPVVVSEYEVSLSEENSVADFHYPIALNLVGTEMRVSTAKYGAEWRPSGVEWWPGTDVRKVIAVPYQPQLIDQVFTEYDKPIIVRLRNGAALHYQISDILRINTFEIENLLSNEPSVAIILHGEESADRWVVIGHALQETIIESDEPQVLEEIDFLTVHSCDQTEMRLVCEIEIASTDTAYLADLMLTDLGWWQGGKYPLSYLQSVECEADRCRAVLAGVARQNGTAVIVHQGETPTVQKLSIKN